MYDSVNPNGIPANAEMVAGYVDGRYRNVDGMRARFPHAVRVWIAVSAHTNDGHVLDIEKGDATPAESVGWVVMRRDHGADPSVYTNASQWAAVRHAFTAAGVKEPHYWIAKWDGSASIPVGAVAKQFANHPNYDTSIVASHWPGVDPAVAPKPVPKPIPLPDQAVYTARDGDSLSTIAVKYGLSLPQIKKLNPQIANPNLIYPGERIYVSGHPVVSTYVIQSGDTLSSIATAHHLTLSALEKKNPQITNPNKIYPGDKVFL
jgi:LysM repeat protein